MTKTTDPKYAPRTPEQEEAIVAEALRRIDFVWHNNIRLNSAVSVFTRARQALQAGSKRDALRMAQVATFHADQVQSGGYYPTFREPAQADQMSAQYEEASRIKENILDWMDWALVAR